MSLRLLAIFPRGSETFEDVAAVPPLLASGSTPQARVVSETCSQHRFGCA